MSNDEEWGRRAPERSQPNVQCADCIGPQYLEIDGLLRSTAAEVDVAVETSGVKVVLVLANA